MRAIWKGSISFGLVNIPIGVFPAIREEESSIKFNQLRKSDLSRIRYKKVAEADGKEVPTDQIVKGYEYEKDKWITLTDEDFDSVEIASSHTIEISDFVDAAEINPKFYETPYFLEALKGGEKGYTLLHRALFETGKVGIAKVAIRSREYLAAVKPDGLFLMLEMMHFAAEVLEPEGLKPADPKIAISPREMQMAKQLVESMAGPWDPEKYRNEYREAVQAMLDAKIKKQPPAPKGSRPITKGEIVDLVAILQESISKAGATKSKARGSGEPRGKPASMMRRKRGGNALQPGAN